MNRICVIIVLHIITIHLVAQSGISGSSAQYLFTEFSPGIIKLKNGRTEKMLMNYNMVTEKMVYAQNDKLMDLTSISIVDTIVIQNLKFVPIKQIFQEVVVNDTISLFIQHKGKIIAAGKPSAYGGTSQTSSTKSYGGMSTTAGFYNFKLPPDLTVKTEPVYWIMINDTMYDFIDRKGFLKIFPEYAGGLKQFMKKNHIRIYDREDLIKLVNYCNELML